MWLTYWLTDNDCGCGFVMSGRVLASVVLQEQCNPLCQEEWVTTLKYSLTF